MNAFFLRVRAPFAAFRWLQAGSYRATSPVVPPSAAWGLVLNLAGIETRGQDDGVSTLVRDDAPAFELAIGGLAEPGKASIYQQLHVYPVGDSGKDRAKLSHGSKFWIAPVRRELLVDFDAVIGVRTSDEDLLVRVAAGLRGELSEHRYGLPFAGDNNFLIGRIDLLETSPAARWFSRLRKDGSPRRGVCRLSIAIDREDSSRTESGLYAPVESPCTPPPEDAWTWVPRQPA